MLETSLGANFCFSQISETVVTFKTLRYGAGWVVLGHFAALVVGCRRRVSLLRAYYVFDGRREGKEKA